MSSRIFLLMMKPTSVPWKRGIWKRYSGWCMRHGSRARVMLVGWRRTASRKRLRRISRSGSNMIRLLKIERGRMWDRGREKWEQGWPFWGAIPARWFIGLGFLGHFVAADVVAFIYCHGEIRVKVACGGEDLNIHPFIICKGDDSDGSALIAIGHQDIAAV